METFIILSLVALAFILSSFAWMQKRKQENRDKESGN